MKGKVSFIILLSTLISTWILVIRLPIIKGSLIGRTKLIYEFSTQYKQIMRLSLLYVTNHNTVDYNIIKGYSRLDQNLTTKIGENYDTIFKITQYLYNTGGVLIKNVPIERFLLEPIRNKTKTLNLLERLIKSEDHRQVIVLDVSFGNYSLEILKLASELGMFNSSYHWLLIDEDYNSKRPTNKSNILKIEMKFQDTVQEIEQTMIKDWIEEDTPLIKFLSKLDINMNTELMLAKKINPDQEDYILFDIWNPGWQFGGKLNVTKAGRFSHHNGLQIHDWFKRTSTIVRRMDMRNVPIRCMIVVNNKLFENFVNYLEYENNAHLDSMHRFNFALLLHVRDIFNFSFQMYRTSSWGYLKKDNTFDGMIGALTRHEVDIGGSPAIFYTDRARVIDYAARTWILRPCFIFRHPYNTKLDRIVFLQPFSNSIWMCLTVSGLAIIILLWKLRKTEENLLKSTNFQHCNKSIEKNIKYETTKHNTKPVGFQTMNWKNPGKRNFIEHQLDIKSNDGDGISPYSSSLVAGNIEMKSNRHDWKNTENNINTIIEPLKMEEILKSSSTKQIHRDIFHGNIKKKFSSHKSKLSNRQIYESSINTMDTIPVRTNYDESQNNTIANNNVVRLKKSAPDGDRFGSETTSHPQHVSSSTFLYSFDVGLNSKNVDAIETMRKRKNLINVEQHQKMYPFGNYKRKKWSYLSGWNFNKDFVMKMGSIVECILFFIAALCQQGPSFHTRLISGRCVVLSTLVFTFCIYQFYSGSIVGSSLREKPKTIKTLRDLTDSSLNLIIEDILYTRDYFKRTTDPDVIELYKRKISSSIDDDNRNNNKKADNNNRNPFGSSSSSSSSLYGLSNQETTSSNVIMKKPKEYIENISGNTENKEESKNVRSKWYNSEEGLKLMKTGGYAFHVDVATAYKIIRETFTEQEICELTEIQLFQPKHMFTVVQKGSPLRKMITYGLRRTTETGLMDRQRKVWHSQKPQCVRQIQPNDLMVGIQTFSSALFVIIFGLTISIVILVLEVIHDLWYKNRG